MVVEDNELNLKLFCYLLRAHGYEADPVRDGREALERARAFDPDLVVMDIQMPHVSGLELIEQMKADDGLKRTPIMAVTAYAAKGDEERIRDAGAEGYVSKPISVVRFVEAVRGLLEAAAERAEAGAADGEAVEPSASAAGDAAAAEAIRAAGQSAQIEKEVAAEGDQAAARAVEASAGAEEVAAEAVRAAEEAGVPSDAAPSEAPSEDAEQRHARESGHPASSDEDGKEGDPDPGLRRDDD
jgi:two-component system cell cycle response regulator DivK